MLRSTGGRLALGALACVLAAGVAGAGLIVWHARFSGAPAGFSAPTHPTRAVRLRPSEPPASEAPRGNSARVATPPLRGAHPLPASAHTPAAGAAPVHAAQPPRAASHSTRPAANAAVPRPPASIDIKFPREWHRTTYEVGPVAPTPPVRVVCGTCRGNLVDVSF